MIFPLKPCKLINLVIVMIFVTMMSPATSVAQIPALTIKIADTTAVSGALNTPITIFMDNVFDDIAAFNLWIQLDPLDIMLFQTNTDTVQDTTYWICNTYSGPDCIDSVKVDSLSAWDIQHIYDLEVEIGNFDTTGCLVSGWQYLQTRSISGTGNDINIVGIADFSNGAQVPPIPAGQQGGVLLRVLADILPMDDTVTNRSVNMVIQTQNHFSFSRPDGTSINWMPYEYIDTLCFECVVWVGETCLDYERVGGTIGEPIDTSLCDSMYIYLDTAATWDTANAVMLNGSVTVLDFLCGNIDGDALGQIDISDLVYLIDFMFSNPPGPEPVPYAAGNVDCREQVDISDLVFFIDFMFSNPAGPAPCSTCP